MFYWGFTRFCWVLLDLTVFNCVYLYFTVFNCVQLCLLGFYWVLLGEITDLGWVHFDAVQFTAPRRFQQVQIGFGW